MRRLIDESGDGAQSALARSLAVAVPSVNKWALGYSNPAERRWPGIEEHFQLPAGSLQSIALGGPADNRSRLVELLEQALADHGDSFTKAERRAIAGTLKTLSGGS